MNTSTGVSRRQALCLGGAAAAGALLPRPARARTDRRVTVVHSSTAAVLAWAPSYVAEELGYYGEEGVAVDRVYNGSGPGAMTALVSGSAGWMLAPPDILLSAALRGQKSRILAAQSDYQSVHLAVSKEYAARHGIVPDMAYAQKKALASELKGIRVGITAPNSLSDLTARSALKGLGLDPRTDAQILPLGSVPNALAALARGNIDAFTASSPTPERTTFDVGAVIFLSNSKDEMPGLRALSGQLTVVRAADAEREPDLYAGIVKADVRGLHTILEKPEEAGEILRRLRYPTLSPAVWAAVWRSSLPQFRTPYVGRASVEAWITAGAVPATADPKAVDVGEVIDMRFVDRAVQQIGWKIAS